MAVSERELLHQAVQEQEDIYQDIRQQADALPARRRTLVQGWLSELERDLAQLRRQVAKSGARPNSAGLLEAAWRKLYDVLVALSPRDIHLVHRRIRLVLGFLVLQILGAIGLIGYTVWAFGDFDPETALSRQQWLERQQAQREVHRVLLAMTEAAEAAGRATAAAAAAPDATTDAEAAILPDYSLLRAEVESLVATLADLKLAPRDLRLANLYLDSVLTSLDREPPELGAAVETLRGLEAALGSVTDEPLPPIRIIVLGSLLGMITITAHTNWKFRNRWNTVGFIPWYVTKLVGAPVISLAAISLLYQISVSPDLSAAADISSLGLRGASPMLLFGVSILTGLFSNRVFDWLRGLARAREEAPASAATAAATQPARGEEPEQ